MDLRTFVSETLQQIVGGVADAQTAIRGMNNGARVNPTTVWDSETDRSAAPSAVEFDIAVTVVNSSAESGTDKVSGSGGILAVVAMKVGGSSEDRTETAQRNEAVSRVKFSVQISQPADVHVTPDPNRRYRTSEGHNIGGY